MSAQTNEFQFECPYCGQRLVAELGLAGKQIECPTCGKTQIVPFPDSLQENLAAQDSDLLSSELQSRNRKKGFIIAAVVVVVFVLFYKMGKNSTHKIGEPRRIETVQTPSMPRQSEMAQRQSEMAAAMLLTQLLINQNANKQRANIYPTEDDLLYPNSKGWREKWRKKEEQRKHEEQVQADERLRLKTQEEYYREQRQRYPYNYNAW